MKKTTAPRAYRMTRRADATARTREAILDAAIEAFWSEPSAELTLDRVAQASGVTVQTVLRHYGSKDGLFEAAVAREAERVAAERDPTQVRSPAEAVRQLVAHYERLGERVLRVLGEAQRVPAVDRVVSHGVAFHKRWCETVFASTLAPLDGPTRRRRLAQLMAVCDVYAWQVLRRHAGLSRAATEAAMGEMVSALLAVR